MKLSKKRQIYAWIGQNPLFLVLPLAYMALGCFKLRYPGLQYDELLFGNVAVGSPNDGLFIVRRIYGYPVLLMPYIGALKSYLYALIFKVLGVSVFTIRVPVIIVGTLTLYLSYALVRIMTGTLSAIFVLVLLSFDASFLFFVRTDVGPNALELLLKMLALLSLFIYFNKQGNIAFLFCFAASILLGLFNKLNFTWFINGLVCTYPIFYFAKIRSVLACANRFRKTLIIVIALGAILSCYLYYFTIAKIYHLGLTISSEEIIRTFPRKLDTMTTVLTGHWFLSYLFKEGAPNFFSPTIILLFAILAARGVVVFWKKDFGESFRFETFLFSFLLLLFLQIIITPQAVNGWHSIIAYPLIHILFASSTASLLQSVPLANIRTSLTILIMSLWLWPQVNVLYYYFDNIDKNDRIAYRAWSTNIYDLIHCTQKMNGKFISADWGVVNQLVTFDPLKYKYYEMWGFFNRSWNKEEMNQLLTWLLTTEDGNAQMPIYLLVKKDKDSIFLENNKNAAFKEQTQQW